MIIKKTKWHHAVPGRMSSSNEVHVWRLLLNEHYSQVESLKEFLSEDELLRSGKFHFEKDQNSFIIARGILRMILGGYLGMKPNELSFEYTSSGKPVLVHNNGDDKISFNLSHSTDVVLYAVTLNRNVGIDVESIRDTVDVVQIANRFFSASEIQSLDCIPEKQRPEKFFQYWTRKEAFLKATGEGVSFPMEQCNVSLVNGNFLSPIELYGENSENSRWYVRDLFPGDGYVAAIAIEGNDSDVSCWHYSFES